MQKEVLKVHYNKLSNEQLLSNLSRSLKYYKVFQMYVRDINDDNRKLQTVNHKFEDVRHEYLNLLKEAKTRGLKLAEEDINVARMLFN